MQVIYGLEHLHKLENQIVLTIGNFDGVHRGHQKIIKHVVELAKQKGLLPVLMTFEFHPLKLLNPQRTPDLLMPMEQKLDFVSHLGIKLSLIAHCTRDFLKMERERFVQEILIGHFQINAIIEGPNFHFGSKGSGNIEYLREAGKNSGFDAICVKPVEIEIDNKIQTISSTLIRKLIKQGRVESAAQCLGRRYALTGIVVTGSGRGKTLGFPTANLQCEDQLLPKEGVYAAVAEINGKKFPAAASIGPAPTFEKYHTGVEAFLIDFDADLYKQKINLELCTRMREIQKFDDIAKLTEQMKIDVKAVRKLLNKDKGLQQ